MEVEIISWDEFAQRFQPELELETYGEDFQQVAAADRNKVWTMVDTDEGDVVLVSGLHYVNRINYLLSKVPHNDAFIEVHDD